MKNTGTLKVTTPSDREIVLTRVFDAPRSLVFDAFTKPELLKRWFGPRGFSLVVCEKSISESAGHGASSCVAPTAPTWECAVCATQPPERSVHTRSFDDFRVSRS
jgi:uncharacterized protein YndB with AHSA1/START domain